MLTCWRLHPDHCFLRTSACRVLRKTRKAHFESLVGLAQQGLASAAGSGSPSSSRRRSATSAGNAFISPGSWFGDRSWIQYAAAAHEAAAPHDSPVTSSGDAHPETPSGSLAADSVGSQQPSDAAGHMRFSLMCYNILGDSYAQHYVQKLYPFVPRTALKWSHRRPLIAREILHWSPDIITLQEVEHYGQVEQDLRQGGYEGVFLRRTGSRRDGCATFWKASRFRLLATHPIHFNKLNLDDNVALIVELQPLRCNRSASANGTMSTATAASASDASSDAAEETGFAAGCSTADGRQPPGNSPIDEQPQQSINRMLDTEQQRASLDMLLSAEQQQQQQQERQQVAHATAAAVVPLPHLLVSNTHLVFDPVKGDVKTGQVRTLMAALAALIERGATPAGGTGGSQRVTQAASSRSGATDDCSVMAGVEEEGSASTVAGAAVPPAAPAGMVSIVTGDFNTLPGSALYRFCLDGQVDLLQHSRKSISGQSLAASQLRHLPRHGPSPAVRGSPSSGAGAGGSSAIARRSLQPHHAAGLPAPRRPASGRPDGGRLSVDSSQLPRDGRPGRTHVNGGPTADPAAAAATAAAGAAAPLWGAGCSSAADGAAATAGELATPSSSGSPPAQSPSPSAAAVTACGTPPVVADPVWRASAPADEGVAAAGWPGLCASFRGPLTPAVEDGSTTSAPGTGTMSAAQFASDLDHGPSRQEDAADGLGAAQSTTSVTAATMVDTAASPQPNITGGAAAARLSADGSESGAGRSALKGRLFGHGSRDLAAGPSARPDVAAAAELGLGGERGAAPTSNTSAADLGFAGVNEASMSSSTNATSFADSTPTAGAATVADSTLSSGGTQASVPDAAADIAGGSGGATAAASASGASVDVRDGAGQEQAVEVGSSGAGGAAASAASCVVDPAPSTSSSVVDPAPSTSSSVVGLLLPVSFAKGMLDRLLRSMQSQLAWVDGSGWTRKHLRAAMGEQALDAASAEADRAGGAAAVQLVATHPLRVASSYATVTGAEPSFTSSHAAFHNTCDYIFYTPRSGSGGGGGGSTNGSNVASPSPEPKGQLRPVSVLAPPPDGTLPYGLPAAQWGSDHIALVTTFELTP